MLEENKGSVLAPSPGWPDPQSLPKPTHFDRAGPGWGCRGNLVHTCGERRCWVNGGKNHRAVLGALCGTR